MNFLKSVFEKFRPHPLIIIVLLLLVIICSGSFVVFKSRELFFPTITYTSESIYNSDETVPFPVGVNPETKTIVENPLVDTYRDLQLASNYNHPQKSAWWQKLYSKLAQFGWYQNLASPVSRILVVLPGQRKEEVAKNIGEILDWDTSERELFLILLENSRPLLSEGKIPTGNYLVEKDADPENIVRLFRDNFEAEVLSRYPAEVEEVVPLEEALTIASILEREAAGFADMRMISGVIWNRLFIDMPLQLDATLQYAKANRPSEVSWWPPVRPADKYIESPFNTYANNGLPPSPIANSSIDAIIAALNPNETDCLFYFHDIYANFYCSETYEEHVAQLKTHYGRGR